MNRLVSIVGGVMVMAFVASAAPVYFTMLLKAPIISLLYK